MGRDRAMVWPSPWLAGVLVAVLVVNVSPVDGMAPNDPSLEAVQLTGDGGNQDVGEGVHAGIAAELEDSDSAAPTKAKGPKVLGRKPPPLLELTKNINGRALEKKKRRLLAGVQNLLKHPIVDPPQEKAFKKAKNVVDKAKKKIVNELTSVEEMYILSDRASELDAKTAAQNANWASHYAQLAGGAVERAFEASGGCLDSHVGICQSVQAQGHCGITAYAQQCKEACHLCYSKRFDFPLGSSRERRRKREVQRAGRAAARREERMTKHGIKNAK